MPYCETEGGRLFYSLAGREDGEVLVLSHCLGSSSEMWQQQLDALGQQFRLLLYDHRGHGQTSQPGGEWHLEDFGTDLLTLLDALELGRVNFCGLSLGGMVGLWMAQHAPQRLAHMVVANTSAFTEDPALLRGRIEAIARDGVVGIANDVLERWFTAGFHRQRPDLLERFRDGLLATSSAAYAATSHAICAMDLRPALAGIDTPVLVITGRFDRATPPAWGEAIAAAIPEAEHRQFEAAHLSNVEAAADFNAAVLEFLRGGGGATQPGTL